MSENDLQREAPPRNFNWERISPKLVAFASLVYNLVAAMLQIALYIGGVVLDVLNCLKVFAMFFRYPATIFITFLVIVCSNMLLITSLCNFAVSWIPKPFRNGLEQFLPSVTTTDVLCQIPIVNLIHPCPITNSSNFEELVAVQENTFKSLSSNSLTHLSTALDITYMTDRTLPDMIHMLTHSDLPGRNTLIEVLQEVISQGRPTARNLQKFGGAVQNSLDVVIGVNRVYIARLEHERGLPYMIFWWSRRSVQLLWRALALFSKEVENINTAFIAARDSLMIFQARLNGALAAIKEELHLETQDQGLLWRSLWDRLINPSLVAQQGQRIHYLERALNVTEDALEHVFSAQVTIDIASDGFAFLKDRLDLYIDPKDPDAVELQYETVVQSIHRLSDLRVTGFGRRGREVDLFTF